LRTRLRIAAFLVLVAGLAGGATIYFVAEDDPAATAYNLVGGVAYPIDPATSKLYVRDLQRFGGKAAVLFDEFNRWFVARWEGRALGVTIGSLSAATALVLMLIARRSR